ncbi:MAG TPA: VIT and VWA domain-containing protein, partial [Acidobacteriaceae bacterium]|nr:VIT and VWA domain-containing protein [Acidobacteriaceae bacterium]
MTGRKMSRTTALFCKAVCMGGLLASLRLASADSGVLIPMNKQAPDPSILSLSEMEVDVHIDNGDARVWVRQIFANHSGQLQEGNYVFALPGQTQVSDFAVWDGPTRIPAVILERKRAQALYQELKSQAIDPGLLQQGERTEDDARRNSAFSAHIVPIPAWGTKRLEMEYHQRIPLEAHKSYFVLPLKPDAYASQHVAHLVIHFELRSVAPIREFALPGKQLSLKIEEQTANSVRGTIEASNIDLAEDFTATWGAAETGNAMQVIAYRNPDAPEPDRSPSRVAEPPKNQEKQKEAKSAPGYFEATAELNSPVLAASGAPQSPRTVVVLMDTSLSMQWEKLERSYAAAAKTLQSLRPQDRFNLLLFNTRVDSFRPSPVAADAQTVMTAIEWLRNSHLRGGTDMEKALEAGLTQADAPQSTMILLTDGGADRGEIRNG